MLDGYEQRNIFDGKSDLVIENNSVSACITGFSIYKNKYNTDRTDLGITLRDNEFIGLGETFGLVVRNGPDSERDCPAAWVSDSLETAFPTLSSGFT